MSAKITTIADSASTAAVYEAQEQDKQDSISELEMLQKLMRLLGFLQELENMLTGNTVASLELIADQSKSMVQLSVIAQKLTEHEIAEYEKRLEAQKRQNFWQKLFGGIASGLMIVLGAALCVSGVGAGAGATMIALGLVNALTTLCPEALDKAIDFLSGGNVQVAAVWKTAIIVGATVAGFAVNPAMGFMMLANTLTILNPIETYAEAIYMDIKGVDKETAKEDMSQNLAVKIVTITATLACTLITIVAGLNFGKVAQFFGKAAQTAVKAEEGIEMTAMGEKAATSAEDAAMEAAGLARSADAFTSGAAEGAQTSRGLQLTKNTLKNLKKAITKSIEQIRAILLVANSATQAGSGVVTILQAKTGIEIGKSQKAFTTLDAVTLLLEAAHNFISELTKQDMGFMENLQKSYQNSSQAYIEKIFIDQVNFAHLLAQSA